MSEAETIRKVGEVMELNKKLIAAHARNKSLEIANIQARKQIRMIQESLDMGSPRWNGCQIALDILSEIEINDPDDDEIVVQLADELKALAIVYRKDIDANAPFEPWINHLEFMLKRKFPRLHELLDDMR